MRHPAHRPRRIAPALCALVLVLLCAPPASAAHRAAHAHAAVRLAIDSVTPTHPRPDGTVRISGRVVVSGRAATGLTVRLRYSNVPLTTRSELNSFAAGPTQTADPPLTAAQSMLRGTTTRWHFTVPVNKFGATAALAVYPIGVEVVDAAGTRLSEQRTFLPVCTAKAVPNHTKVAWLWPVIDRPHQADDGTFTGAKPDQEFAAGGRLSQLLTGSLNAPKKVPLTWVIDPAVVDDAQALAASHRLLHGHGTKTVGGSAAATAWLNSLSSAVATAPVAVTPYGDPDVAALTRVGLERDLQSQTNDGAELVRGKLHKNNTTKLGWPLGGLADNDMVDAYTFGGARTIVLSTAALPADTSATDMARGTARLATSDGTVRVLLADQTLSQVIGGGQTAASIRQRFLAETALIDTQNPTGATVVAAPPQRWSPTAGLVKGLLADSATAPWLQPVSALSLRGGSSLDRKLDYPAHARGAELGHHYLTTVRDIRLQADRLSSVLSGDDNAFDLGIARLESSAWRDHPKIAFRTRDQLRRAMVKQEKQIHFINRASITLSGSKADIPIVVANENHDRSATVRVVVTAPKNHQLSIGSYPAEQTIGPGQKVKFKIPVRARAVGISELSLGIETTSGESIGTAVPLKVRVTNLGATATWITGVAVGIVVLAIGWRALRRKSSEAAGEKPTDDDSGPTQPDPDPAPPGDQGARVDESRGNPFLDHVAGQASHPAAGPAAPRDVNPAGPTVRGGYPYPPDPSSPPTGPAKHAATQAEPPQATNGPGGEPRRPTDSATEARG